MTALISSVTKISIKAKKFKTEGISTNAKIFKMAWHIFKKSFEYFDITEVKFYLSQEFPSRTLTFKSTTVKILHKKKISKYSQNVFMY